MSTAALPLVRAAPRVPLAPAVARRMLRFELERLCGEANVRHDTVAQWLGVSRPAVTSALACKNLLRKPALEVLCNRLGREAFFPRLAELAQAARHRNTGRPATSGVLDAELSLGLEAFADEIVVFDPWLVPPQLQTPAYAAAIARLDDTAHGVARELPFAADDPLPFRWITSEHALRRRIGGRAVVADQLAHLLGLPACVTIRVIPATAELPPANPFQLVRGAPTVVVEPSRLAFRYTADVDTVACFARHLADLEERALTSAESLALLNDVRP